MSPDVAGFQGFKKDKRMWERHSNISTQTYIMRKQSEEPILDEEHKTTFQLDASLVKWSLA